MEFKGTKEFKITKNIRDKSNRVQLNNGVIDLWYGEEFNVTAKEAFSNARLIAAAPELLEALQEIHNFNRLTFTGMGPDYTKMMDKAEQAINKALNHQTK